MMNLNSIALKHKTDKASDGHNYAVVYEQYLREWRFSPLLIFELGIGGYEYPDRGGESLKMWADYFPKAKIVGIDIYEKKDMATDRILIEKGSQTDESFLNYLCNIHGEPNLIIDDASHINPYTIRTFEILFTRLRKGGLYFVEDIHTSFWRENYDGDPDPLSQKMTTAAYFQRLTPQLCNDTLIPQFRGPWAGYLDYIHFYRNLVIVRKK